MTEQLVLGAILPLPFWLWLRLRFGARGVGPSMLLDLAPVLALWLLVFGLTARPLLAGLVAAVLPLAIGIADDAKRRTLQEPLVFTDTTMVLAAFRHPRLYLPFLRWWAVLAVGLAGPVAMIVLLALEPPVPLDWYVWLAAIPLAVLLFFLSLVHAEPLARRLTLARDPRSDGARFGPFATFGLHRAVARMERAERRAAVPPKPSFRSAKGQAPHVVMLQLESFCDPRRLNDEAPRTMLPNWDALCRTALARGQLSVPGFGANTNRTEFVVLTGVGDEALGLDRLNPYYAFAREPVTSLAWALRGADYETICVHPFDPRFFARDKVLPALGFHRFEAEESFGNAPRVGHYISDASVGAKIVEMLYAADGPRFLYAITMQAHGPWPGPDPLETWRGHMADADAMIGTISQASALLERPLLIVAFGDHRPALPIARGGTDTDYLIWRSDLPGDGGSYDLDALKLHRAIRAAAGLG